MRRWADAGRVRTFRTPGGHRRFSFSDLERLTRALADDGAPAFDDEARAQIQERLHGHGAPPQWLQTLAEEPRAELAVLGRETVHLVELALSDGDEPSTDAAGDLGRRYAALLRGAEVGLSQAIDAFAYFRQGMDEAVRSYANQHGLSADEAADLWQRCGVIEDGMLVAMAAEFEKAAAGTGEDA